MSAGPNKRHKNAFVIAFFRGESISFFFFLLNYGQSLWKIKLDRSIRFFSRHTVVIILRKNLIQFLLPTF